MRMLALALGIVSLAGLCQPWAASKAAAARPRIVMVVAPRDFTDREYSDPRAIFDGAGAAVRIAGTSRQAAVSHAGVPLQVDQSIGETRIDQFDAMVLVGGMGALTFLMDNEALRNLVAAAVKSGKVVAAICVAPAVLAHAGVLRNERATCFPDERIVSVLKLNGADYVQGAVVVSGRIVTASGPEAAKDFARRVLEVLRNEVGSE